VKRLLIVAAVLLAIVSVVVLGWASRSTSYVRDHIIAALNAHFSSRVQADDLQIGIFPHPFVSGKGLRLQYKGRTDVPPLIALGSFEATAGIPGLFGTPLHLRRVMLERLDIHVPAGGLNPNDSRTPRDHHHDADDLSQAVATSGAQASPLLLDEVVTRAVRLEIASGKPGRLPRVWDIEDVVVHDYGRRDGGRFQAGLINPVPHGRIDTSGRFGPWNGDDPGLTPVEGEYTFSNANLDVIDGIGGILSSTGRYRGVLERLDVEGQTSTPDFSIDVGGQKVPLTTRFKAVVDGTNGDTWLDSVNATLGKTTILAKGAVVRTQDVKGRKVALDVRVTQGRLEDLLRLAVKGSKPPLLGRIDVTTKFLLPAGKGKVEDRLQLDGRFNLAQARFANVDIQKKITMLSQKGRGQEDGDGSGESVVSNLRGRFALKNAALSFRELAFGVPGAVVELTGSYDLRRETMDFSGYLLTDASLADMTSGIKSVFARLAQPLFRRKGGGSKLPIRISGTRTNPSFKLDIKRVFSKD
jgi:hypothetical protein